MNQNKKFKTVYDVPMTYSGLLDDVVQRHKITPEVDETFFNRSIVRNVFFSGRIFINDGYLVNHPSALNQLLTDGSLLREMIKVKFVVILARQQDPEAFAGNPEKMAANGVKTFQQLIRRSDWPELKRRLQNYAEGLYSYDMIESWPPVQIHAGFKKLFERIFDKSLDDLGLEQVSGFKLDEFRKRYEGHDSYAGAPRTAVEETAMAMAKEGVFDSKFISSVMNIANQCYHYNFAMCLTNQKKEPVVADTTIGLAFEDILDLDDAVEAELDSVPVLSVPKGFPVDNGRLFDMLLEPGSDLSRAKHQFLRQIDEVFKKKNANRIDEDIKVLAEASDQYQNYLAEHFSEVIGLKDWAPRRDALITFGLGKIGSVIGADNILLAANLAAGKRVSSFIHRLTKPVRRRALKNALNPNAGEQKSMVFHTGDIRPRFASLAFDRKAVRNHVKDLPSV